MKPWSRTLLAPLFVCLGLAQSLPACAADAVTDAMQAAYPAYRAALFATNTQDAEGSSRSIAQARQAWAALMARHAAAPPAPYDRDVRFAATLSQVAAVYAEADAQVRAGQLPAAHETLEAARDLMADLRRRNQVIVYSDHMNAYHAEMEHVLQQGPALLSQPQGTMLLMARVGALTYLAEQLKVHAPAALAADAGFTAGLGALTASVEALRSALLGGDAAAVRAALAGLKPPYSKLFLKFG